MRIALDWRLAASVFATIFVAELPDKTAFATVLLAAGRHPGAVFLGAAAAFAVQSLVAVAFGEALSALPARAVKCGAGLLFLGFAASLWLRREDEDEIRRPDSFGRGFAGTIWAAFLVIFAAEWGDLTQLATAALAAKSKDPVSVFAGATSALWAAAALAVLVGHRSKAFLHPRLLRRAAAFAFLAAGAALLLG